MTVGTMALAAKRAARAKAMVRYMGAGSRTLVRRSGQLTAPDVHWSRQRQKGSKRIGIIFEGRGGSGGPKRSSLAREAGQGASPAGSRPFLISVAANPESAPSGSVTNAAVITVSRSVSCVLDESLETRKRPAAAPATKPEIRPSSREQLSTSTGVNIRRVVQKRTAHNAAPGSGRAQAIDTPSCTFRKRCPLHRRLG
jgi:hypothetical protein